MSFTESDITVAGDETVGLISNTATREALFRDIKWTAEMDDVWKEILVDSPKLAWQYVGTEHGMMRTYPGYEHSSNIAGMYNDYDPRYRPWFLAAEAGPRTW